MTDTSELEQQARRQAADLGRRAKGTVEEKLHESAAAAQAQAAAEAAASAAQAFDPGSMQAQAAQAVAGRLEDAARQVRSLDLEETVQEVSAFARRNPLLFLSAAALAGFAATRFLKASAPEPAGPAAAPIHPEAPHAGS
ncbi:hypothetical protein KUW17_13825 [Leisingera aquaemixtae]|uniref:hypothetical protein n=1 Tax=Leisingera aquaemixtae TaxID=1396826 RepID=UPI001C94B7C8|nr:hypothetical protein [Leisingera aquaemixtae]MBY6067830.1 hypothetical protein [Leisingera aquaemixtae]